MTSMCFGTAHQLGSAALFKIANDNSFLGSGPGPGWRTALPRTSRGSRSCQQGPTDAVRARRRFGTGCGNNGGAPPAPKTFDLRRQPSHSNSMLQSVMAIISCTRAALRTRRPPSQVIACRIEAAKTTQAHWTAH